MVKTIGWVENGCNQEDGEEETRELQATALSNFSLHDVGVWQMDLETVSLVVPLQEGAGWLAGAYRRFS